MEVVIMMRNKICLIRDRRLLRERFINRLFTWSYFPQRQSVSQWRRSQVGGRKS